MFTGLMNQVVARAAYGTAANNANSVCGFFFYQPKLPEKVKKLRKF